MPKACPEVNARGKLIKTANFWRLYKNAIKQSTTHDPVFKFGLKRKGQPSGCPNPLTLSRQMYKNCQPTYGQAYKREGYCKFLHLETAFATQETTYK